MFPKLTNYLLAYGIIYVLKCPHKLKKDETDILYLGFRKYEKKHPNADISMTLESKVDKTLRRLNSLSILRGKKNFKYSLFGDSNAQVFLFQIHFKKELCKYKLILLL